MTFLFSKLRARGSALWLVKQWDTVCAKVNEVQRCVCVCVCDDDVCDVCV